MKRLLAICAILLASCLPSLAQPVTVIGAVTPGHCVSFFSTTQIQDTGAGCGLGGGGVSSVGLLMPVNTFAVTGSPVTTSGTLNATLITQAPNTFFAGPSAGGPLAPTWRALTSTDLPVIGPAQGGTGLVNPAAHSLLIAEGAANFNLITATVAGRMILDQGSGLDFSAAAMSGDCTLIATGAITCTKFNGGTSFGTFAAQNFASPPIIGGTSPNSATFTALTATGGLVTNVSGGGTQCLQVNNAGLISGIGAACAAVGPVSSVSNSDATLTVSPTTGNIVASLNLGHINTWTAAQTFSAGISASAITNTGITGSTQCLQVNSSGLMSGAGAACGTAGVTSVSNADGTLTVSPTTGAVVASLALAHANTWTAKQTISGASFSITGNQSAPAWTTNGIRYVNVPGTLTDTSSIGTVAAAYTGFFGGNTIAASNATTFTNYYEYYYTAPVAGSNVTFTNSWALGADSLRVVGNAAVTGTLTLTNPLALASGGTNASLTASNGGVVYSTASAFAVLAGTVTSGQCLLSGSSAAPTWGSCTGAAAVSSVTAADSTLTITPTTGAVTAKINLGNTNTWTAKQTISGAGFALSGNISAAAWTTNGVKYANVAGTVTDTTSSGTVATAYTDVFGGDTVASSIATTFTNYYAQYIKAPVNGANVTFTNGWALGADSLKVNGVANITGNLTTNVTGSTQCLQASSTGVISGIGAACGAVGPVSSVSNADGTLTVSPTTGAVVASIALGHANTWSAVQTHNNGTLSLAGATSGNTLLQATAVAGAGTVATFPANTGIVAELNLAQSFSAVQTFSASNGIVYSGAAVGTQVACLGLDASNNVVKNAAACGSGGGGTPGGSNTQLQYNNSGAFGGTAGITYNGTAVNFANNDLTLGGSSTGVTTFSSANAGASNFTLTFPAATDTVAVIAAAQTFTNKTLTASTNVLGGVTMTLGSDATGDVYYRAAGGVLTRLAIGTTGQVLTVTSGLPSWAAGGGGGTPAKGTVFPSSMYLGGASGNLSATVFVPTTNTNSAGAIEVIGVVASLAVDAPAVLQFNMPEVIPSGTLKLRVLAWSTASSGVAKLTVKDKNVAAGSSLGTSTLNTETQLSQTWATADIIVENKITLTSTPAANDILQVLATFNSTGWTLAAVSGWQFSIVWE